jgi:hypothetical protein
MFMHTTPPPSGDSGAFGPFWDSLKAVWSTISVVVVPVLLTWIGWHKKKTDDRWDAADKRWTALDTKTNQIIQDFNSELREAAAAAVQNTWTGDKAVLEELREMRREHLAMHQEDRETMTAAVRLSSNQHAQLAAEVGFVKGQINVLMVKNGIPPSPPPRD